MLFEETASFNPRVGPSLNHLSALVPKAPAPSKFSHSDAQTHRLLVQSMQFIEDKMHGVHSLLPTIEQGELLPVL